MNPQKELLWGLWVVHTNNGRFKALRVIDEAAGNPLHCDVVEPIPAEAQGLDFYQFKSSSYSPPHELLLLCSCRMHSGLSLLEAHH